MSPRTCLIALIATLATLGLPASASAEYLVPEGNSAVTQYTEGFPTAGGEKKTEGDKKRFAPAEAIGAGNARKLEDRGEDGAAAAELAAETAPEAPASTADGGESTLPGDDGGGDNPRKGPRGDGDKHPQADGGSDRSEEDEGGAAPVARGDGPDGSSGLSEVLGAATGSSGGSLGPLLPLALLAALAWGLGYAWRHRHHAEPTVDGNP